MSYFVCVARVSFRASVRGLFFLEAFISVVFHTFMLVANLSSLRTDLNSLAVSLFVPETGRLLQIRTFLIFILRDDTI